ncbi:uncharacterized protein [Triticum aestivum]|uniref:uncharacterized protein isoform X4 n=1 Tax=Triticum aestivum TaxID=4565 RepID=UPI001D01949D|nr:uncharacterized protein LOC123049212 isoform X4 [Triticum aestivum]
MTTGLPLRDLECSGDVNCSIDPVCAAVDAIQGHLRAFATSRITPKQAGLVKLRKHNVKVNQDAKPGAALESSLLAYQTYHPPASDVQRSRHHPLQIQLVLSCLHLPSTKVSKPRTEKSLSHLPPQLSMRAKIFSKVTVLPIPQLAGPRSQPRMSRFVKTRVKQNWSFLALII